jgi:tripartite-type tricarboxylate transporter receptor subunit TctC
LRGDIQMAIENYAAVRSHIADRAVIAVSSSGPVRTSFLPEVPTVKEAGGGDFEARSWNAIFAPKGTPPEVIGKLAAALDKALDDPAVEKRLADLGGSLPTKDERSPAKFDSFVKAEIARWSPILKAASP